MRLVGNNAVWLEDIANPSGTFTTSELAELNAFYSSYVEGVHDAYFGGLSDVDGNGRVLILMTAEVNKADDLAGWVRWNDLRTQRRCSSSNQAEIFYGYVPDPLGAVGEIRTKEDVFEFYPLLLAHEIAHLVQGSYKTFGTAGPKTAWEIEGGATMAEQLVAYEFFGHDSGRDLGNAEYRAGEYWYWNAWVAEMFEYFGWDSEGDRTGRVQNAPEECSWIGRESEGNTGPCRGVMVYGVPSMMLRFVMDRWGDSYPGGERALMQRLTQTPLTGFASLEDVSDWPIEQILAEFYMALWGDGRVGDFLGMASWNLDDIFAQYSSDRQLQPHNTTSLQPEVTANVRAGSSLYVHWTPSGSLSPTSFKVTGLGGSTLPDNVFVWVLRLR